MSIKKFISENHDKVLNIMNSNKNDQTYRLLILGRSGSGKSYWAYNFLKLEKLRKVDNKQTVIFCFTPEHNNEFYEDVAHTIYNELDEETIKKHLSHIIEFTQKYKKTYRIIILFDDIINEKLVNSTEIMNLFARARHYGINLIFLIQSYTRVVTPFMRNNITHYLLFALNDAQQEKKITRELILPISGDIDKSEKDNTFKAICIYKKDVLNVKYGNILIDYNKQEIID